ncbi:hypothetical protein [Paracoccus siganidrum]|nr:hypothetical protein [Paracoccus siganidrum]
MSEKPEPPFTAEQIAWLDARYRLSLPQLERKLQEQGKEAPADRNADDDA